MESESLIISMVLRDRRQWLPLWCPTAIGLLEEFNRTRDNLFSRVCEHVVTCVIKALNLRLREKFTPAGEKVFIEAEVLRPPKYEHGSIPELLHTFFDGRQRLPAWMFGVQRDVLHECAHRDSIFP